MSRAVHAWLPREQSASERSGSVITHAVLRREQQHQQSKIGRPIVYTGDPNAADLTDQERRRIKRRIANRESARRVRRKRQDAMEDMQEQVEVAHDQAVALAARLQQAEGDRALLLRQLQGMANGTITHPATLAGVPHADADCTSTAFAGMPEWKPRPLPDLGLSRGSGSLVTTPFTPSPGSGGGFHLDGACGAPGRTVVPEQAPSLQPRPPTAQSADGSAHFDVAAAADAAKPQSSAGVSVTAAAQPMRLECPAGKTRTHPIQLPSDGPVVDLQTLPSLEDPLDIFACDATDSLDSLDTYPSMGLHLQF